MFSADGRPVRRVQRHPSAPVETGWPWDLPAVRQLLEDGLDLPVGVTFLVGENGSGKSTLVEAVAQAYGLNAEGGSAHARHVTRVSESRLGHALQLVRDPGAPRWGFFLRAETMHGLYSYLEQLGGSRDPDFHRMSHGESFLALFQTRFDSTGFYVMDEPEAALSFRSSLTLLAVLDDLRKAGGQVLVATHSPVLASLPGALVLEVGEHGLREVDWADLDLVRDWKGYLDAPERWLRHLL